MVNVCFNISIQYQIFVTSSFPIPLSVYALPMTAFSERMAIKTSAFCCVLPYCQLCVVFLVNYLLQNTIKMVYYQINYIQKAILLVKLTKFLKINLFVQF